MLPCQLDRSIAGPDCSGSAALNPNDLDREYLAHDLRQLLWAIQGQARILESKLGGDHAAELARIALDAETAAAMLANEPAAQADPVSVATAAWQQVVSRAQALGQDVSSHEFDVPREAPGVAAPPHVLRRILGNLLANAVEAMPGGGKIRCHVELAGTETVAIDVRDHGPGIADSLRMRLFDAGATAGKEHGHGLGLAGSRNLARRHGGDLALVPSASGAWFQLTLPQASTAHVAEDTSQSMAAEISPLRLLAVDDEAPVREMLQELLALDGHEPVMASDHDSALACFRPGHYHAALVDLGLPGRSGPDLAAAMRAQDPSLAVIVITGWGREKELAGLDPRCVDFSATKPLDLPALRQLLVRAAALTAQRRGRSDLED